MITPSSGTESSPAIRALLPATGARRGNLKIGFLCALFLVEVLALTTRFDSKTAITGLRDQSISVSAGRGLTAHVGIEPATSRKWIIWLLQQSGSALAL